MADRRERSSGAGRRLEEWILHPFLFGIYPVMFLLAANTGEVAVLFTLRSLIFSILLSGVCLLAFRLLLGDWRKAALVTSLAVGLFFLYGHLFGLLKGVFLFGLKLARHRLVILFFGSLLAGFTWWVYKKINLPAWTRAFNLIGLIAVILPLVQINGSLLRQAWLERRPSQARALVGDLQLSPPQGVPLPDIYVIILDTYTRRDAMQVNFGYDNTAFTDALAGLGFYVAECSRSNYSTTVPSISSLLNFNYTEALDPALADPGAEIEDLYPYLQDSTLRRVLEDLGYVFLALDSGYSPTDFRDAGEYYSQQSDLLGVLTIGGLNPFEVLLLQTSAGAYLYDYSLNHPELKLFFDYAYILHRNRITFALDKLPRLTALPGPKFVFVHLLAPHNPFVFGPHGEQIIRQYPFSLDDDREVVYPEDYAAGYTDEVTYLNARMLAILEQLLSDSDTPPIILLQGDHGIPRIDGWHMPILNAYHLPGGASQALYASISPVNSFRVILNGYFGGQLELLPDVACDAPGTAPFDCRVYPDPNPQCAQP